MWQAATCDCGARQMPSAGSVVCADPLRERAAGMKAAAGRRVDRVGRVAGDRRLLDALRRVHRGPRGEQSARVGMQRPLEDRLDRADLDDAAEIHHQHPVAEVLHDVQIVADEDISQVELALEARSRFSTCASTDLSSAETGSSRITMRGPVAKARAILTRCFWPPDSSCG